MRKPLDFVRSWLKILEFFENFFRNFYLPECIDSHTMFVKLKFTIILNFQVNFVSLILFKVNLPLFTFF